MLNGLPILGLLDIDASLLDFPAGKACCKNVLHMEEPVYALPGEACREGKQHSGMRLLRLFIDMRELLDQISRYSWMTFALLQNIR